MTVKSRALLVYFVVLIMFSAVNILARILTGDVFWLWGAFGFGVIGGVCGGLFVVADVGKERE